MRESVLEGGGGEVEGAVEEPKVVKDGGTAALRRKLFV